MSKIVVKAKFNDDVRRLPLPVEAAAYPNLMQTLSKSFNIAVSDLSVKYQDDEGDMCTLTEDTWEDLMLLSSASVPPVIRITLYTRGGNKPAVAAAEPSVHPRQVPTPAPEERHQSRAEPRVESERAEPERARPTCFIDEIFQRIGVDKFRAYESFKSACPPFIGAFLPDASAIGDRGLHDFLERVPQLLAQVKPMIVMFLPQVMSMVSAHAETITRKVQPLIDVLVEFILNYTPQFAHLVEPLRDLQRGNSAVLPPLVDDFIRVLVSLPEELVSAYAQMGSAFFREQFCRQSAVPTEERQRECPFMRQKRECAQSNAERQKMSEEDFKGPFFHFKKRCMKGFKADKGEEVHPFVRCDGCGVHPILGPRFVCRTCPNYDLCGSCMESRNVIHPGHTLERQERKGRCERRRDRANDEVLHFGITCDGCGVSPLVGTRFKCTVCPDFDFCQSCHTDNTHGHEFEAMTGPCGFGGFGWRRGGGKCRNKWGGRSNPHARFLSDLSFPDGSDVPAGASFVKTWRVRNESNVPWPDCVRLERVSGTQMGNDTMVLMSAPAPGEEVDVSMELVAPSEPGHYATYFMFLLPSGRPFGDKLWLDVFVRSSEAAAVGTAADVPDTTPAGPISDEAVAAAEEVQLVPPASAPASEPEKESVQPEFVQPIEPVVVQEQEAVTEGLKEAEDLKETDAPVAEPAVKEEEPIDQLVKKLQVLHELGFTDDDVNLALLARYEGNVRLVVQELLSAWEVLN